MKHILNKILIIIFILSISKFVYGQETWGERGFYVHKMEVDSITINKLCLYELLDKYLSWEQETYYYPDFVILIDVSYEPQFYERYPKLKGEKCYVHIESIGKTDLDRDFCENCYGCFIYNDITCIVIQNIESMGLFEKTGKKHTQLFYERKPGTLFGCDSSRSQTVFVYDDNLNDFIAIWESLYIGLKEK